MERRAIIAALVGSLFGIAKSVSGQKSMMMEGSDILTYDLNRELNFYPTGSINIEFQHGLVTEPDHNNCVENRLRSTLDCKMKDIPEPEIRSCGEIWKQESESDRY
jgi:hypothetical protein